MGLSLRESLCVLGCVNPLEGPGGPLAVVEPHAPNPCPAMRFARCAAFLRLNKRLQIVCGHMLLAILAWTSMCANDFASKKSIKAQAVHMTCCKTMQIATSVQ